MTDRSPGTIDRREILGALFPSPSEWLFVSGLAGASKDTAALTGDGPNLFSMAGAMGAAVPMGLGMALSDTAAKVAVVTGDGELLMGIGALVTVASAAPSNLTIICLDNARHGETGGQSGHTAGGADLAAMARGAGLQSVLTISDSGAVENAARFLVEAPGPRLIVVRVAATPPTAFKRDMDLAACRVRFRDRYLKGV